jgi:hypothetical protein
MRDSGLALVACVRTLGIGRARTLAYIYSAHLLWREIIRTFVVRLLTNNFIIVF